MPTYLSPGKSLAYTRVDFYNAAGQLAAYGRAYPSLISLRQRMSADESSWTLTTGFGSADHTKYIGRSGGHKEDVKFSEDGESVVEGEDVHST